MRQLGLILTILVGVNLASYSQTDRLIPEAQTIKIAYDNLQKNPDNKDLQLRYVSVFPDDAAIFKQVFHSPTFDQLYKDSHLYIFKLAEFSNDQPVLVGDKLIKLCIGLKKSDADAIGYVQKTTMGFTNSNYSDFIGLIKKLSKQDLNTLTTFLADVENHSAYHNYETFIQKLKSNSEPELFDLFKNAREARIKQKEHGF